MAKVPFNKLKCEINKNEISVQIGDETIAVKQYLPIQEKLALIGRVIEFAHEEDQNFSNPVKVAVYRALEIVFTYTNISFTDKQKEDLPKLYDSLYSSGIIQTIISNIPETEYLTLVKGISDSIEAVYKYQNSALGILDSISTDYSNLNLDATDIQEKLSDPENLKLVKGLLTKIN